MNVKDRPYCCVLLRSMTKLLQSQVQNFMHQAFDVFEDRLAAILGAPKL